MFLLPIIFLPLNMSHLGDSKFPKDSSDLEEILSKSTWGRESAGRQDWTTQKPHHGELGPLEAWSTLRTGSGGTCLQDFCQFLIGAPSPLSVSFMWSLVA